MTTTLATQAPTFHALTGTQPVGQTQVATKGEVAGTVTTITRENVRYWVVNVRSARNAFVPAKREQGKTVSIWLDALTGAYVVDYWGNQYGSEAIEADRTRSLQAAIGVAVSVASQRWLVSDPGSRLGSGLRKDQPTEGEVVAKKDTATYVCPRSKCNRRTRIKIINGDWIIAEHKDAEGKWCKMGGEKL